eukprot:scaffold6244_cov197-Pinguiococcus_pyrenoidosus.AAC.2
MPTEMNIRAPSLNWLLGDYPRHSLRLKRFNALHCPFLSGEARQDLRSSMSEAFPRGSAKGAGVPSKKRKLAKVRFARWLAEMHLPCRCASLHLRRTYLGNAGQRLPLRSRRGRCGAEEEEARERCGGDQRKDWQTQACAAVSEENQVRRRKQHRADVEGIHVCKRAPGLLETGIH